MDIHEALARLPMREALLAAHAAGQIPAWIVGGAVRDLLLGRDPVDIDIATHYPEPLANHFAEQVNGRVVLMDADNGIYRVAFGNGYFDFCRFRDTDIIGDLYGRDFTFNAIALRLPERGSEGGLLDPFHGVDDLNAGLLRMVSPQAFTGDPARVLRAFRFMAQLDMQIEDDTLNALQAAAINLTGVAPERILAEWWKLCAGPFAATAIERMDEAGALGAIFPELADTKLVTQNAYHHLDVWEHTLLATTYMVRAMQHPGEVFQDLQADFEPLLTDEHRRARLVFITLIHDIGKPPTRSVQNGSVHFYAHELVGAEMAHTICRRLRMSTTDTRVVTQIIRNHMRPTQLLRTAGEGAPTQKSMMKLLDAVGPNLLENLALSLVDKAATRGPASDPEIPERLHDLYRELLGFHRDHYTPAFSHPLLNGNDLTHELHLPPGPKVGELLTEIRRRHILGKLATREEALRWAKQQVKGQ